MTTTFASKLTIDPKDLSIDLTFQPAPGFYEPDAFDAFSLAGGEIQSFKIAAMLGDIQVGRLNGLLVDMGSLFLAGHLYAFDQFECTAYLYESMYQIHPLFLNRERISKGFNGKFMQAFDTRIGADHRLDLAERGVLTSTGTDHLIKVAMIGDIRVLSDYRNQGVGSALMKAFMRQMSERVDLAMVQPAPVEVYFPEDPAQFDDETWLVTSTTCFNLIRDSEYSDEFDEGVGRLTRFFSRYGFSSFGHKEYWMLASKAQLQGQ